MNTRLSGADSPSGQVKAGAASTVLSGVTIDHIRPPGAALPAGSCDCHVHIFDPVRFPYATERTYTPAAAVTADLLAFERRLGIDRIVLVQPSGYGTDNSCLLDALRQLSTARARGVAVIDLPRITASEIDGLHAAGVRSIRLNLEVKGEQSPAKAKALLTEAFQVVESPGWSIQIYADASVIASVADLIAQAHTPVVLDHFGGIKAERGLAQPGFSSVLELIANDHAYVKLSAPYRASKLPGYEDLAPFAHRYIETAPHNLVWASDWPHTGSSTNRGGDLSQVEPFRLIDDGASLDLLRTWAGDAGTFQRILVDNAARLYGF
ncbi:amidohydrolase family protein [Ottowia thiooxydans]|uniref:amidohydrolase family protein n=1 Tax=Ottowia thiooxydans TaxID=219182 RepID=UPI00146A066E|nr:amidohydrolase family protein [Ottowia thiooxydans]